MEVEVSLSYVKEYLVAHGIKRRFTHRVRALALVLVHVQSVEAAVGSTWQRSASGHPLGKRLTVLRRLGE